MDTLICAACEWNEFGGLAMFIWAGLAAMWGLTMTRSCLNKGEAGSGVSVGKASVA